MPEGSSSGVTAAPNTTMQSAWKAAASASDTISSLVVTTTYAFVPPMMAAPTITTATMNASTAFTARSMICPPQKSCARLYHGLSPCRPDGINRTQKGRLALTRSNRPQVAFWRLGQARNLAFSSNAVGNPRTTIDRTMQETLVCPKGSKGRWRLRQTRRPPAFRLPYLAAQFVRRIARGA